MDTNGFFPITVFGTFLARKSIVTCSIGFHLYELVFEYDAFGDVKIKPSILYGYLLLYFFVIASFRFSFDNSIKFLYDTLDVFGIYF